MQLGFLWPPRPETKISKDGLREYEDLGWVGQVKKNGTCSVAVTNRRQAEFYTRHGEPHKAWLPSKEAQEYFNSQRDSVIVFELLHNKHASVKNGIYLFDILVHKGTTLEGATYQERYDILEDIVPRSRNIKLAQNYEDLERLYSSLDDDPLAEGIVIKNPRGVLRSCYRRGLNSGWQVKSRFSHRNFPF